VNVKTRLGGDALVRKWRVGTSIIDLTLRIRLMVADSIVKTDANTYRAVLGNHAVMISADGPTSIRPVNDRYELLHMVPLRMIPTCAEPIFLGEVEAEYSW
jgi:hypothetical protein